MSRRRLLLALATVLAVCFVAGVRCGKLRYVDTSLHDDLRWRELRPKNRDAAVPVAPAPARPAKTALIPFEGSLAVLELQAAGKSVSDSAAEYFTDLVRAEAVRSAPKAMVMTRENLVVILKANAKRLEECEGECEVETGRLIGADVVVSGRVIKFADELRLLVKMHATASGRLLRSDAISGKDAREIESGLTESAPQFFGALRNL